MVPYVEGIARQHHIIYPEYVMGKAKVDAELLIVHFSDIIDAVLSPRVYEGVKSVKQMWDTLTIKALPNSIIKLLDAGVPKRLIKDTLTASLYGFLERSGVGYKELQKAVNEFVDVLAETRDVTQLPSKAFQWRKLIIDYLPSAVKRYYDKRPIV